MSTTPILRDEHGKRLTEAEVRGIQETLNRFHHKYLLGRAPLLVDGEVGAHTLKYLALAKYYVGYGKKDRHDHVVSSKLVRRLRHPRSTKFSTKGMIAVGIKRRKQQHVHFRTTQGAGKVLPGVTTFDGIPVAKAAVPFLLYARAHGWNGRLVSGWRDPIHSRNLCIAMCGAPSCPGKCAGLSSNHVGSTRERFAIDVSDFTTFRRIITGHVIDGVSIFNDLPIDPVHFSPNGH